ncbi:MAG: DmsC/YnfH family molybdoenzyme membrane anchor subunit [Terracidiphilus sp.]|jgi:DMSO reductase iron-sulfur subunit
MALPLHERAFTADANGLVRLTTDASESGRDSIFDLVASARVLEWPPIPAPGLIPKRELEEGEQYRFHFNMTKCIGCRSCEIACNEQNGNPAEIHWRRFGEIEGGTWPDTQRSYLSMGCNHCLDAECVKGCPVEAYTKDPATGIVLHSADACIGCQYCVWNCPYSVPQFNPERGVVGKCDMCHGRLEDGLEPACVNACPESAIEIEIVNMAEWRKDYTGAESPGMPAAGHTISTTRITLPESGALQLERVDLGHIQPEHAHLSLVFMTTLMQAVSGALIFELLNKTISEISMVALLLIASVALTVSAMHLGRPAYAWRALKMWRRSWISREVLFYSLFFAGLGTLTALSITESLPDSRLRSFIVSLPAMHLLFLPASLQAIGWTAAVVGIGGTISSAYIYLVPARPAWNMIHTPLDFLLTTALLGSLLATVLQTASAWVTKLAFPHLLDSSHPSDSFRFYPVLISIALWFLNQLVRRVRLSFSRLFERRASASLLATESLQAILFSSFALVAVAGFFALAGLDAVAFLAATIAALLMRYLFFVSVVPLNMALTFVRGGRH